MVPLYAAHVGSYITIWDVHAPRNDPSGGLTLAQHHYKKSSQKRKTALINFKLTKFRNNQM